MDMIDFFANEYIEENWKEYVRGFEPLNIYVNGISQDIVNTVLSILGVENGVEWLNRPLKKFEGKNALDLLKSDKGEKALKAYIMRLPL